MRLHAWEVQLEGDADTRATALVFAADEQAAGEVARRGTRDWGSETFEVLAAEPIGDDVPRILDLDLADPDIERGSAPDQRLWWVPHLDGLLRRREGASLVVANDAASAERLVADADPFEGQPPYGRPPAYGPAEPFAPAEPTVVWIDYEPAADQP